MQKLLLAALLAAVIIGGGEAVYTGFKQRGLRNNNPGNIRYNAANAWQGQTGQDDKGFVVFDTPVNGVRAMARILKGRLTSGRNTVTAIITSWAPAIENDTNAYIARVAKALGVGAASPLNPTHLPGLIAAIIQHENGAMPYPASLINQAIAAAA